MKPAQKIAAAALSLVITAMGVALVSAPAMLAGSAPALTGVHLARAARPAGTVAGQAQIAAPRLASATDSE